MGRGFEKRKISFLRTQKIWIVTSAEASDAENATKGAIMSGLNFCSPGRSLRAVSRFRLRSKSYQSVVFSSGSHLRKTELPTAGGCYRHCMAMSVTFLVSSKAIHASRSNRPVVFRRISNRYLDFCNDNIWAVSGKFAFVAYCQNAALRSASEPTAAKEGLNLLPV